MSRVDGLGVTFDTCHALGSGYDIASKYGLDALVKGMENTFGLDRLKLIHLNDSKQPLASYRDRHEHIGQGHIGEAAFGRIINHKALRDIPFIMETPKVAPDDDKINLSIIRRLRMGK
jgi:deoxyribonuclease-4